MQYLYQAYFLQKGIFGMILAIGYIGVKGGAHINLTQ